MFCNKASRKKSCCYVVPCLGLEVPNSRFCCANLAKAQKEEWERQEAKIWVPFLGVKPKFEAAILLMHMAFCLKRVPVGPGQMRGMIRDFVPASSGGGVENFLMNIHAQNDESLLTRA